MLSTERVPVLALLASLFQARMPLAPGQPSSSCVEQPLQVIFHWAAFQPLFPKPGIFHGLVIQAQVQVLSLTQLALAHQPSLCRSLFRAFLPQQISTPAQCGVLCRVTEGGPDPLVPCLSLTFINFALDALKTSA